MLLRVAIETAIGIYFLYRLVLDGMRAINVAASVAIVYYIVTIWITMDWLLAPFVGHIPFFVDLDMYVNE